MTDPLAEPRAALAAWGATDAPLRLVSERENAVYQVTLAGTRAALRLHRPGYQTEAAIRSELWWCAALADAGFPAPRPIPARDGSLTAGHPRLASVVTWLEGTPIGAAGRPLAGTPQEQAVLFRRIGHLAARLHTVTDSLALPPWFERPHWSAETLLGDTPRWGRFWQNPALTDTESAYLDTVRHEARPHLEAQPDTGLIHADLMRENLLDGAGGLSVIDFDDSGLGWRMYELGSVLFQNLEEPALPALAAALLDGYAAIRPLPPEPARALTLATMLRTFASCGWAMTRAPDPAVLRRNAGRALRLARMWRDGGTLTG